MDARDASIVAQVAAKVAGSVCCASGDTDKYLACVETVHNDLIERIGTGLVTQAFPGAEIAVAPGADVVAPQPAPVAGPTQQTLAAAPAPNTSGRKVYPRVDFCVGKQADERQAAWNLLAFQPNEWADGGTAMKVYDVKEHADGTTDLNNNGKNFPNFSVTKEAMQRIGVGVTNNVGLWVNEGDSNVPLKVWDQAAGQTQADAVDFPWESRRQELQQFAYSR